VSNGVGLDGLPPGAVIRLKREQLGLNQRELAERVGHIDAAGVSKIETGTTKLGRARAKRFARALDLPISLLLPLSPQPTIRDVLDRLEELSELVEVATGNQERLLALVEHLAEPARQADERES